jgi:hypothetical protein
MNKFYLFVLFCFIGQQKGTPQYKSRFLLKLSQKTAFILRGPIFCFVQ